MKTKLILLSVCCFSFLVVSPLMHSAKGEPGYAIDPVFSEYDVDVTWPKRPENVSGEGWVSGLDIDANQNIWMFRKGPDPVQVYKTDGTFVRTWGKGNFKDPHQLRIDPEGNVWVADFGLHIIQKYTPEGKLLQTIGVKNEPGRDETHFNRPTDMAIAPNGDIFVTDGYTNRRVVHFDKNGKFIKTWGEYGTKPGNFVIPHAIEIDKKGNLYVCDRNSGRVQIFNQEGKLVDMWSGLLMPWGITYVNNEILICGSSPHWWYRHDAYPNFKDQLFMRFSPEGRIKQVWTIPVGKFEKIPTTKKEIANLKPGETVGAHCIVQDAKGNIYIGDIWGERTQKYIPVSKRKKDQDLKNDKKENL